MSQPDLFSNGYQGAVQQHQSREHVFRIYQYVAVASQPGIVHALFIDALVFLRSEQFLSARGAPCVGRELSVPVTVKIRALEKEADTLDLVRRLEGAGAQMLTGKVLLL